MLNSAGLPYTTSHPVCLDRCGDKILCQKRLQQSLYCLDCEYIFFLTLDFYIISLYIGILGSPTCNFGFYLSCSGPTQKIFSFFPVLNHIKFWHTHILSVQCTSLEKDCTRGWRSVTQAGLWPLDGGSVAYLWAHAWVTLTVNLDATRCCQSLKWFSLRDNMSKSLRHNYSGTIDCSLAQSVFDGHSNKVGFIFCCTYTENTVKSLLNVNRNSRVLVKRIQ